MSDFYIYYPLWGLGWASYSATAQNPKVGASPELKIHQKSIKNPSKIHMRTSLFDKFGPSRAGKSMKNKNGHEMVKETSPRPLGTTVFEEI